MAGSGFSALEFRPRFWIFYINIIRWRRMNHSSACFYKFWLCLFSHSLFLSVLFFTHGCEVEDLSISNENVVRGLECVRGTRGPSKIFGKIGHECVRLLFVIVETLDLRQKWRPDYVCFCLRLVQKEFKVAIMTCRVPLEM